MTAEYQADKDDKREITDKDSITAEDIGRWFGSEAVSLLSSSSASLEGESANTNETTRPSSPNNVISATSTERHKGRPIKKEKEGKIQMSVYADSVGYLNLQKRTNDSSIADTLRRVITLLEGSEMRMYQEHLKDLKEIANLKSQVLKQKEACELKDQAIKELRRLVDECLK